MFHKYIVHFPTIESIECTTALWLFPNCRQFLLSSSSTTLGQSFLGPQNGEVLILIMYSQDDHFMICDVQGFRLLCFSDSFKPRLWSGQREVKEVGTKLEIASIIILIYWKLLVYNKAIILLKGPLLCQIMVNVHSCIEIWWRDMKGMSVKKVPKKIFTISCFHDLI